MLERGIKLLRISGIFCMILGTIHTIFAIFFLGHLLRDVKFDLKLTMYYMFIVTGIAIILNGIITLYISKFEKQFLQKTIKILLLNTSFMIFAGTLAVALMYDNPFAYLTLLAGIIQGYGTIKIKRGL